jgi:uracil-DNA glycosylase
MSPQSQAHRPRETSVEPEVSSLEVLHGALSAKPYSPDSGRAVVGEGPVPPAIAFSGKQPGDEEDRMGCPFVDRRATCSTAPWPRPASTAAESI